MGAKSRLSVISVAAVAFLGCISVGGFSPPEVTLVNVRFEDLTLFESSGRLTVRVANENNEPVLVDGGVYNLYLNGMKVGKALSDAQFEIPRLSSTTAEVDVFINNLALATRIKQIIDAGTVEYRLKGKFFLDRSVGRRKIGFDRIGRYDFRQQEATSTFLGDPE
jgi:LEA14-like dessication related protein